MAEPSKAKGVGSGTNRREMLIAIVAGLAAMALIVFGVLKMSSGVVGQTLTGEIIAKEFTPQAETQVTIGSGGVRSREVKGEYMFEVKVPNDQTIYRVWVDEQTFQRLQKGDTYSFPRPKS
jgi:FlaG/FlaF family flagellin (archaellin)